MMISTIEDWNFERFIKAKMFPNEHKNSAKLIANQKAQNIKSSKFNCLERGMYPQEK